MPADTTPLDALVIQVRADTSQFMAGIGDIGRSLDGPLADGVDRAGRGIERSLARALATGRFGFDDLRRTALSVLADIGAAAIRSDLQALFGGGGSSGGGGLLSAIAGLFGGAPGRATGGPVTGGRAYMVGERGPELFVPTSAGRIQAAGGTGPVNITVNVAAPREASPVVMARTGDQVARAVRQALARASA